MVWIHTHDSTHYFTSPMLAFILLNYLVCSVMILMGDNVMWAVTQNEKRFQFVYQTWMESYMIFAMHEWKFDYVSSFNYLTCVLYIYSEHISAGSIKCTLMEKNLVTLIPFIDTQGMSTHTWLHLLFHLSNAGIHTTDRFGILGDATNGR